MLQFSKLKQDWSSLTFKQKVVILYKAVFAVSYWLDVKLVHLFVGGYRMILLALLSTFSFMPPAADRLLRKAQTYTGLFIFLLIGLAISNFVLARMTITREVVGDSLGKTFVSDHKINMKGVQLAKVAVSVTAGIGATHIDNFLNDQNNIHAVGQLAETLQQNGQTITPQQTTEIMQRSSQLQQVVSTGLSIVEVKKTS